MEILETTLPGVILLRTRRFDDARGSFCETWRADRYADAGLPARFVQDNLSRSLRNVLRGLHYQQPRPQAKLITALAGAVFDVAVDIRAGSPTRGQWFGAVLSAENGLQLFIPEGFAHGFVVLSDEALVHYKCSDVYDPACDRALRWDDPALAIEWPVSAPILSAKDAAAPALADLAPEAITPYPGGRA